MAVREAGDGDVAHARRVAGDSAAGPDLRPAAHVAVARAIIARGGTGAGGPGPRTRGRTAPAALGAAASAAACPSAEPGASPDLWPGPRPAADRYARPRAFRRSA